jgi:hypothetical protein
VERKPALASNPAGSVEGETTLALSSWSHPRPTTPPRRDQRTGRWDKPPAARTVPGRGCVPRRSHPTDRPAGRRSRQPRATVEPPGSASPTEVRGTVQGLTPLARPGALAVLAVPWHRVSIRTRPGTGTTPGGSRGAEAGGRQDGVAIPALARRLAVGCDLGGEADPILARRSRDVLSLTTGGRSGLRSGPALRGGPVLAAGASGPLPRLRGAPGPVLSGWLGIRGQLCRSEQAQVPASPGAPVDPREPATGWAYAPFPVVRQEGLTRLVRQGTLTVPIRREDPR